MAVQFFPTRSATDDIEIAGTLIPNARIMSTSGGAPVIHACFGGPLARLEVNLAVEAFRKRVENPRLIEDPPEYRQSNVFRGPRHLFIEFDRIRD